MNQNENSDWIKNNKFDYLIIGSGLCESMVSYLLVASDPSIKVLQVDPNFGYGQSWAAVSLDQLESIKFNSNPSLTSSSISIEPTTHKNKPSSYSISIQPTLVPARGKFVDTLISSNVAPYLSFQLLHAFIFARPNGTLLPLPGSKHDLFRMDSLSLIDKRLLMRFFQSILSPDNSIPCQPNQSLSEYLSQPPFSITNPELISIIASLSLSTTLNPTAQGVYDRLKTILLAVGRHASPNISALPAAFLLGEYGGAGDWAEGFVRAAAITGRAVQVIGRPILSLQQPNEHNSNWSIRLGHQINNHSISFEQEDFLEFSANKLLISQEYYSSLFQINEPMNTIAYTILRGIAIINQTGLLNKLISSNEGNDLNSNSSKNHALIVFPPQIGLCESPVHVLIVGSDSGSCPEGEEIIYLTTSIQNQNQLEPSKILKPILNQLLFNFYSIPLIDQESFIKNQNFNCLKFTKFYSQFIYNLPKLSPIFSIINNQNHNQKQNHNENNTSIIIPSWPIDIEKSNFFQVVESLVDEAQIVFKLATTNTTHTTDTNTTNTDTNITNTNITNTNITNTNITNTNITNTNTNTTTS